MLLDRMWCVGTSKIHGQGMFANRPIIRGQIVDYIMRGRDVTEFGKLVNHQLGDPSGIMEPDGEGDWWFIAVRDIEPGEELSLDYWGYRGILATPRMLDPKGWKGWK